jgi:hypothetical protein
MQDDQEIKSTTWFTVFFFLKYLNQCIVPNFFKPELAHSLEL